MDGGVAAIEGQRGHWKTGNGGPLGRTVEGLRFTIVPASQREHQHEMYVRRPKTF